MVPVTHADETSNLEYRVRHSAPPEPAPTRGVHQPIGDAHIRAVKPICDWPTPLFLQAIHNGSDMRGQNTFLIELVQRPAAHAQTIP